MAVLSSSLSLVNVNGLNPPIKRQTGRMDKKQDPTIFYLQETPFRSKDTHKLKMKG